MTQYRVHIDDRAYTKWTFYNAADYQEVDLPDIHPATNKLLTNDTFIIEDGKAKIVHSSFRNQIPAVLILKAAKVEKGSGTPNTKKVGSISKKQIEEIAKIKMPDLNAGSVESAMRSIEGTAKSCGLTIQG